MRLGLPQREDPQRRGQRRGNVPGGVHLRHQTGETDPPRFGHFQQDLPERRLQRDAGPVAGERKAAFDQIAQSPAPILIEAWLVGP